MRKLTSAQAKIVTVLFQEREAAQAAVDEYAAYLGQVYGIKVQGFNALPDGLYVIEEPEQVAVETPKGDDKG